MSGAETLSARVAELRYGFGAATCSGIVLDRVERVTVKGFPWLEFQFSAPLLNRRHVIAMRIDPGDDEMELAKSCGQAAADWHEIKASGRGKQ